MSTSLGAWVSSKLGQKASARERYTKRMKRKVTAFLACLVVLFVLVYVPASVLDLFSRHVGSGIETLLRLGISVPIIVLLQWVVFAQDHLANGRSKASDFFRYCYASSYAMERYGIPRDRAQQLWFDYFNQWAAEDHPNNEYYRMNFERSYSLRLIFYLKRMLFAFSAIALLFTLGWAWAAGWNVDHGAVAWRVGIAVVTGAVATSLTISNRAICQPNASVYGERYAATGAYAKFGELAGILRIKFEDDVLSKYCKPTGSEGKRVASGVESNA